MTTRIEIDNGTYTVVHNHGTNLHVLRHGMPWRDMDGDGLVRAMAQEIEALREQVATLQGPDYDGTRT